jgi:hypothetical protein
MQRGKRQSIEDHSHDDHRVMETCYRLMAKGSRLFEPYVARADRQLMGFCPEDCEYLISMQGKQTACVFGRQKTD